MLDLMQHRGPDGAGLCVRGPIGIGMRRLAIIDVIGGVQPIFNEDETIAIVCNGEIYNHRGLRSELEAKGHKFRTHSDVEVILHLYEEVGRACFARLNGMFGVAIADFRDQTVVLARDPFGQKPLYLWQDGSRLLFASELKSLAQLSGFSRKLSEPALASFLRFRYIPAPLTIYEHVRKLLPGSYCVVEPSGNLREHRYFQIDLSPGTFDPTPDPDGALTRQKLMETVDRHLMTERPLGVFLSGGLDSSAIVACMQLLGHRDIHTYTVGFEGFLDNEFANAQDVAAHFNAEHSEVLLTSDMFWESLDEVVYSTDEPLGDLTTVPLYHLSKAASRELVVVLSGEGADELLGGYPGSEQILRMFERHQSLRAAAPLAKAAAALPWPDSIGRKLENIAGSAADYLAHTRTNMTEVFTPEDRRTYVSGPLRDYDPGGALADYYTGRQSWDGIHLYFGALIEWWLPDDLLHKADRMTMAHSLELRCPFLDLEFARHCARLTLNHKLRSVGQEPSRKIVLKKAFEPLLPPGIAMQKKKGFAIPVYTWLVDRYAAHARRELDREEALGSSLLTRDVRHSMLEAAQAGDVASQHRVWSIIVLNKWGDRWL